MLICILHCYREMHACMRRFDAHAGISARNLMATIVRSLMAAVLVTILTSSMASARHKCYVAALAGSYRSIPAVRVVHVMVAMSRGAASRMALCIDGGAVGKHAAARHEMENNIMAALVRLDARRRDIVASAHAAGAKSSRSGALLRVWYCELKHHASSSNSARVNKWGPALAWRITLARPAEPASMSPGGKCRTALVMAIYLLRRSD